MKIKFLILSLFLILSGCQSGDITLPDLTGLSQNEIEVIFNDLGLEVGFIERTFVVLEESNLFIEYGMFYSVGDVVEERSFVPVIVSAKLIDSNVYFLPIEMEYDGPRLDDKFFEFGLAVRGDGTIRGAGGAFEVELMPDGCVDGDTARFIVPAEMVTFTNNPYVRSRFLNFDSPETFSGGEEVFGQPASQYACELLTTATTIVLQTDPGDNLFDRYGRLLAWIWIQFDEEPFELLNYWMVRQGLGEVRYLFGAGETSVTVYDGLTYTEWMFLGEARAQEESLGMHGELLDYYWDYQKNAPNPYAWP